MRPDETSPRALATPVVVAAALSFALLCALLEVSNTSIGWHLATGRMIIASGAIPHADPFSFTSAGAPWIDHEWLFEVVVALLDAAGGAPALVALRVLVVAALALFLLVVGLRSGLAPPAALLLATLCVWGARPRLFVRPELATLLVVPIAVSLYLELLERPRVQSAIAIAALVALGVNLHGAVLVVPLLLGALLVAELARLLGRRRTPAEALPALGGFALAGLAVLANPYGWRLLEVPLTLARLVSRPSIPNPEWVSPTPATAPALYLAVVLGVVVLALAERRPSRWLLLALATALATRHVRNLGLFFVLFPLAVAPALARWPLFAARGRTDAGRARLWWQAGAAALVLVLGLSVALARWPRFGVSFSATAYPDGACSFIEQEGLDAAPLYNDVNFGGFLINRSFPEHRVFIDDRNEIHAPLLDEIYRYLSTSDAAGWQRMLERYGIECALVRYHPPWRVTPVGGGAPVQRGFSVLWFPAPRWALAYWDDVAMVLVRRRSAPPNLLARCEPDAFRPDDPVGLLGLARTGPARRAALIALLEAALAREPGSHRARRLLELVSAEK